MPPSPLLVVLVDDHPALRAGVRAVFEQTGRIEVVGEASAGEEGLRIVQALKPHVALLDMNLPDIDGVEVAERLAASGTTTRVLAYSAYDDRAYVARMLQAGAAGYITKDKPLEMVAEAVEAVGRGEGRWFVSMAPPDSRDVPVSERELEVLRLMAKGMDNKAIAASLAISPNTVRNHVSSVYEKLDVNSWREAVAWAWGRGLVG